MKDSTVHCEIRCSAIIALSESVFLFSAEAKCLKILPTLEYFVEYDEDEGIMKCVSRQFGCFVFSLFDEIVFLKKT